MISPLFYFKIFQLIQQHDLRSYLDEERKRENDNNTILQKVAPCDSSIQFNELDKGN